MWEYSKLKAKLQILRTAFCYMLYFLLTKMNSVISLKMKFLYNIVDIIFIRIFYYNFYNKEKKTVEKNISVLEYFTVLP